MDRAPTVRQLAALAGVSRTTVSLALRNHPSIPPVTRERIQELARDAGYRCDPLVAGLMTQLRVSRTRRTVEKLAYLTNWNSAWEWQKSSNERHYYQGACRRASELGYDLEHFWTREPGMTQSRLSKILYTRGIRGVVIAPLLRARGHLSLDWKHFAVAAVSHTVYKPDIHRATHYHHSGMIMALRNLKHRGYRRIGLANLIDQDERVNHGWLAAYLLHYHANPHRQVPPLMITGWKSDQFKDWVRKHSPDVVLSNTDDPYWLLQELGYRVPQDIGFANLDVNETMPFSGIDQSPEEIGAVAVELVTRQLQNNEFGLPKLAQTVHIDGHWRDGETTVKSKTSAGSVSPPASKLSVPKTKAKPKAKAAFTATP
jgi:LacI family transcriptional regulator